MAGRTETASAAPAAEVRMPGAEAIRLLAEMGVKATDAVVLQVPTAGLGDGYPAAVPVLFDRNRQQAISLRPLLEEARLRPERRTGTAAMETLASFMALVNRHKNEHSAIFADADWREPSLVAVIDYHKKDGEPRHLKHRIGYGFPLSEEWKAWTGSNGKAMPQGEFAAFIEDRIAELAAAKDAETTELEPLFQTKFADPAEIITLSRGLEVAVEARVKQHRVLQSGEAEVVYEEVHRDGSGQKIKVPGLFMINVPVFFGGAPVRIPCRLRYRPSGQTLLWFYQMWRPEFFVTEAVRRDLDAVRVETGLPAYEGAPEA